MAHSGVPPPRYKEWAPVNAQPNKRCEAPFRIRTDPFMHEIQGSAGGTCRVGFIRETQARDKEHCAELCRNDFDCLHAAFPKKHKEDCGRCSNNATSRSLSLLLSLIDRPLLPTPEFGT